MKIQIDPTVVTNSNRKLYYQTKKKKRPSLNKRKIFLKKMKKSNKTRMTKRNTTV